MKSTGSKRRAQPREDAIETSGIVYISVPVLPDSFERITEWVALLLQDHASMTGLRVAIDCSHLAERENLPPVSYLQQLAVALQPLMSAAKGTRCAIIVPEEPFLWCARLFESM